MLWCIDGFKTVVGDRCHGALKRCCIGKFVPDLSMERYSLCRRHSVRCYGPLLGKVGSSENHHGHFVIGASTEDCREQTPICTHLHRVSFYIPLVPAIYIQNTERKMCVCV